MANIALRGNFDIAALNDIDTHLSNVQHAMSSASTEPYLRMGRDGKWIFGADSVEVEKGSQWAIHPLSVEHGYVCWNREDTGQKKLGEAMVAFNEPKPVLSTLPQHANSPWTEQISFSLVCVSGEDIGTQTKYATTSLGGTAEVRNNLLATLIRRITAEKAKGPITEDSDIVPVVTLGNSHYNHGQYGKIYTPIFNIVRWGSMRNQEDTPAPNGSGPAPQGPVAAAAAEEAPRRRQRLRA